MAGRKVALSDIASKTHPASNPRARYELVMKDGKIKIAHVNNVALDQPLVPRAYNAGEE